jgi:hypothetical protein
MKAHHLEILVEEPSMESFLRELLPRVLPDTVTFRIYPSQGKQDLLRHLGARLRGYASFLPPNHRIVVVVDRDGDDCRELKQQMERAAADAGMKTRSRGEASWRVVNRIAVEELEAWYFGDWDAVIECYPAVAKTVPKKAPYRDPDDIQGGTWEAFERIVQRAGYFEAGMSKMEIARTLGRVVTPDRSTSRSFTVFCEAMAEACR